jgi:hypothetical protein
MNRRKIVGLIGAAIAWPFAARAEDWERDRVYRLGFLLPTPRQAPVVAALFDELRVNGLIEGQNLLVIGDGFSVAYDQLPRLAASVIDASPDVIVTGPELPIRTLQKLTQTIPLVGMTEDMVGEGLVASRRGRAATPPGSACCRLNSTANARKFCSRRYLDCARSQFLPMPMSPSLLTLNSWRKPRAIAALKLWSAGLPSATR